MSSVFAGGPKNFVQHTHASPLCNYTDNTPNSWMAVDLGAGRALVPDHYCLRSDQHGNSKLRNWELQGSNDGAQWTTLRQHANDQSIAEEPMATAAWPLEPGTVQGRAFRHFRVLQTGKNAGNHDFLMCAGIELYGVLQEK